MKKPKLTWLFKPPREVSSLKKGKVFQVSISLSLFFWVAQIGLIAFFWRFLPPQVPLFFSRPWGEEQLVPRLGLLLFPSACLLVFLLNSTIAGLAPKEERLISQTLIIATAIFSLLCFISLGQIIRLIT